MENIFNLTAVGLAYDGVGVAILGYAFITKSVRKMMAESGSYWGGNNFLLESLVHSRTDGTTGTVLLVTGFILQWFGYQNYSVENLGETLLGILVFGLLSYMLFLRKKIILAQTKAIEKLRKEQEEKEKSK